MREHRARQLVVAIGFATALAGLKAPPSLGQGTDSSRAHLALVVLYDASAFAQVSVEVANGVSARSSRIDLSSRAWTAAVGAPMIAV